jgi:hypothetical protein
MPARSTKVASPEARSSHGRCLAVVVVARNDVEGNGEARELLGDELVFVGAAAVGEIAEDDLDIRCHAGPANRLNARKQQWVYRATQPTPMCGSLSCTSTNDLSPLI